MGEGIKQIKYRSHPVLRSSDHKPVSALFSSSFKVVDLMSKQMLYQKNYQKLQNDQNLIKECTPNVKIRPNVVNFGDVHFGNYSINKSITLKNKNKKSWIKFSFKPTPEWLIVRPLSGSIPAGKCIRISLELKYYAKFMIKCLNNSWFNLNHELALCILGAECDIKIQVSGNYIPTCFGCPMEKLIQFHMPISQVPRSEIKSTRNPRSNEWSDTFDPFPRELDILLTYLVEHKKKPALFLSAGIEKEFTTIRKALDKNKPKLLNKVSYQSVADSTLLFIQFIPERVIQFEFYTAVARAKENFDMCREVINSLSPVHRNAFNRIIGFLRELCRHSDKNNLNAHIIAKIFGFLMIGIPSPNGSASRVIDEYYEAGGDVSYLNEDQNQNCTRLLRVEEEDDDPDNDLIVTTYQTQSGIIKFNPRQNFIYQFLINDYAC